MKRVLVIFALVAATVAGLGLYQFSQADTYKKQENVMTDKKVLVAYYSYSGNTKAVAEKIQKLTGGDIFEIEVKNPYPTGYNEVVAQAKKEKAENIMPELKTNVENLSQYDVVFIGTPVWWYTMAGPVKTFIANNNFEGKVIAPFCTHGGGGASATYSDMQKSAPKAKVTEGFTTYEKTADEKNTAEWIKSLNL